MKNIRPIATCRAEECDGCAVRSRLHCHFNLRELGHFYLICLPPFLIGGRTALTTGWEWLALYLFCLIGFFGFLEIRVMCSHCPHYAEDGNSLTCWANYGAPKLWAYRPGPMSLAEKIMFFAGLSVVFLYPIPILVTGGHWFELLLYLTVTAGFAATLKAFLCTQCMNFACPLNGADKETRRLFFSKCPELGRVWEQVRE